MKLGKKKLKRRFFGNEIDAGVSFFFLQKKSLLRIVSWFCLTRPLIFFDNWQNFVFQWLPSSFRYLDFRVQNGANLIFFCWISCSSTAACNFWSTGGWPEKELVWTRRFLCFLSLSFFCHKSKSGLASVTIWSKSLEHTRSKMEPSRNHREKPLFDMEPGKNNDQNRDKHQNQRQHEAKKPFQPKKSLWKPHQPPHQPLVWYLEKK